jgi:Ni,Fe-hydrogenase III component G
MGAERSSETLLPILRDYNPENCDKNVHRCENEDVLRQILKFLGHALAQTHSLGVRIVDSVTKCQHHYYTQVWQNVCTNVTRRVTQNWWYTQGMPLSVTFPRGGVKVVSHSGGASITVTLAMRRNR